MNVKQFKEAIERDRPFEAERAEAMRKAIDEREAAIDAAADDLGCIGVRQSLGGGRFGNKRMRTSA